MSLANKQDRRDNPTIHVPKEHRQDWRGFMKAQMALPETDQRWQGMCESLQRQAHGKPAKFASAYAHMIATPNSERMDPREAPLSAFIFVDDTHDSNAFGHIVGKWGHSDQLTGIPVVTNDVTDSESGYDPGNITVCPLGWFPAHWGDSIKFATLWFGGDDVPEVEPEPKTSGAEDTERWVKAAVTRAEAVIELMQKAIKDSSASEHPRHEAALKREIADQRANVKQLRGLLPESTKRTTKTKES